MAQRRPDRTLGAAHDQFWEWCAKGELRLQCCAECREFAWPPVQHCEHCGSAAFVWEQMSGTGRLISWCTFEREYYRGMLPVPWDTILVELDEGPLFVSNPHGFGGREIQAGIRLAVQFIDCEDSAGGFRLPVFAPASPKPQLPPLR